MRYTKTEIQAALDAYREANPLTDNYAASQSKTSSMELTYLAVLALFDDSNKAEWGFSDSRAGRTRRLIAPIQLRQDLRQDPTPPILTARQIWCKGALAEALWMWQGRTHLAELDALLPGASVLWEPWAIKDDRLAARVGPHVGTSYGFQFREALPKALNELKRNPETRRACLSLWQDIDLPAMALPPCHGCFLQFRLIQREHSEPVLCLDMTQRSVDTLVGLPFNLIQYYTLLRLVALWLGVTPGIITYTLNDVHMYEAHNQQRLAMLDAPTHAPPSLTLDLTTPNINLADWRRMDAATALHHVTMQWFKIKDYKHSGKLLFNVMV